MSLTNSYTTLIFDFDYTLADSSEAIIECINYGLAGAGFPQQEPDNIKKLIGTNIPDTFRFLTGEDSAEYYTEFRKHFLVKADQVGVQKTRIFDFVPGALRQLKQHDFKIGIVSTRFRSRIEPVLKRDNIYSYFDLIIGGEDVDEHKPDPSGLLMALKKLKVRHSESLYIGDSVIDAETANSAGVDFVAVLSGATSARQFQDFSTVEILANIDSLRARLIR